MVIIIFKLNKAQIFGKTNVESQRGQESVTQQQINKEKPTAKRLWNNETVTQTIKMLTGENNVGDLINPQALYQKHDWSKVLPSNRTSASTTTRAIRSALSAGKKRAATPKTVTWDSEFF